MCRIAGIITDKLNRDELATKVARMCTVLKHGGPDDEGIYVNDNSTLAFGHRRLSIIDLSKNGHQPMADVQQKTWITFNGEIYNYLEVKAELLQYGRQFHSTTDTEVILNAYLQWGTAAFSKIKGMFAFALYDVEQQMTFLVRDSSGIKPLYYHAENGQLSFASEVKALQAAGVAQDANHEWAIRFLAFGHVPEPYTTLKNVFSLKKGHYLSWNHFSKHCQIIPYKTEVEQKQPILKEETAKEYLNKLLRNAVKSQLMADAPIGVFLSGGVDSSLISLLANEQTAQQLKTISIFFNEKAYDERLFQTIVGDRIKGEKFAHLVQQQDFELYFSRIIDDMDMPTTDGINTWFISKYAHEDGLKAVLSGVGADELFGGYPSFNRIKYLRYLRNIPGPIARAANRFQTDRYRKIAFLAHDHYLADYLLLRGLFVPADIAQILDIDVKRVEDVLFVEEPGLDLKRYDKGHAAWFETNLYMQNQLLRDTDVMSMSHGLEVRVPFLDESFQHLVESISQDIRFNSKQPKKLLIDSFQDLLPATTWKRPKMGFTFPLQEWMSVHPEISNETLYKGSLAQNTVKKFKAGEIHWSKVFALYQIQLHV